MSLAQKLVDQPQREKGGSLAQERFDYQALWGLALIFSNHESGQDYAITFEFHDDVLLLDSATQPASVRFYQVKTKDKGQWTLTDLFRRPPLKPGQTEQDRPLSFMGKLFWNYLLFPNETAQMNFVSNAPLEFVDANENIAFKDCDASVFAKFLERLKQEHGSASQEQAALMQFVRTDLSLHDASTHAKGKLNDFVVAALGEIPYSLDSLFRAVVEDCRTRSKYTGEIKTFTDLIRYKAITRADVEQWLSPLRTQTVMPDWSEIVSDLTFDAFRKAQLRTEWMKYRAKALDAGDEAIRSLRRQIRAALQSIAGNGLSLNGVIDAVRPILQPDAVKQLSPYSENRLIVMILYEVYQYGETGELQDTNQKPAD